MKWGGVSNVREDLPGKATFKQRLEGTEGASRAGIWGRSVPSKRNNSKCKEPETDVSLKFSINSECVLITHKHTPMITLRYGTSVTLKLK